MLYQADIHGYALEMGVNFQDNLFFTVNGSCDIKEISETAKLAVTRWLLKTFKVLKAEITQPICFTAYDKDNMGDYRKNIYKRVADATSLDEEVFYIFPKKYLHESPLNEECSLQSIILKYFAPASIEVDLDGWIYIEAPNKQSVLEQVKDLICLGFNQKNLQVQSKTIDGVQYARFKSAALVPNKGVTAYFGF